MSYFVVPGTLAAGSRCEVAGPEAAHLLGSRRVRDGETVELQDAAGRRFSATVVSRERGGGKLVCLVGPEVPVPPEPTAARALFLSAVPEQTLDLVLRASVELGATEVGLFNSERTARTLAAEAFNRKLPRWQRILRESAKQSGRGGLPTITYFKNLPTLAGALARFGSILLMSPDGSRDFQPQPGPMAWVVGPEGGLTDPEVATLLAVPGAQAVAIGPYTLRVETAASAALAYSANLKT